MGFEEQARRSQVFLVKAMHEPESFATWAICANCPVQRWRAPLSMKSFTVSILVSEQMQDACHGMKVAVDLFDPRAASI